MLVPGISLNRTGFGHGVFCFEDLAAPLINYRQLRERKRIVRLDLGHTASVMNGFVETPLLLLKDCQSHVSLHMIGVQSQDVVQGIDEVIRIF